MKKIIKIGTVIGNCKKVYFHINIDVIFLMYIEIDNKGGEYDYDKDDFFKDFEKSRIIFERGVKKEEVLRLIGFNKLYPKQVVCPPNIKREIEQIITKF